MNLARRKMTAARRKMTTARPKMSTGRRKMTTGCRKTPNKTPKGRCAKNAHHPFFIRRFCAKNEPQNPYRWVVTPFPR